MFKEYKSSVIFIRHIKSFSRFLLLSTSNVRMSEGTFCRVEVHISYFVAGEASGSRLTPRSFINPTMVDSAAWDSSSAISLQIKYIFG